MEPRELREDFPILRNRGDSLIYLDNAATTQKPEAVIDRICRYYAWENANIHRGMYPLSTQAEHAYEAVRREIADWIGASAAEEIVFTKGSTEAVNLTAAAFFETWVDRGDNVVVTELEHSSNYFPWKHQCERFGAVLRTAEAEPDGSLNPETVMGCIDSRTRMLAITAMSNVTGFRPQLRRIIEEAHRAGARVFVDASQEAAHHTINVQEMDCDLLCFSGHKVYGPMGTGVLCGKRQLLEEMRPYLYGGGMVKRGDGGLPEYRQDPEKFEAGTQNIAGVLGLGAAVEYLRSRDFAGLTEREADLAESFRGRLGNIRGIRIKGTDARSPLIAFASDRLGAYDLGVLLGNSGIAVRCGSHCAYPLMSRMGEESLCRISLGIYNTQEELDKALARLRRLLEG